MQLITLLSAATAMVAAASARESAIELNAQCNLENPHARVVNRCDYPVHLWSVFKGTGCPSEGMVTLKTGESYAENLWSSSDSTGVSIKISKTEQCKGNDITQLEYFLETTKPDFNFNYLDVSYVDCLGNDCPTKHEGYYLVAGSQTGASKASAGNTWCPILSCHDAVSCALMSYILPDDVATKSCDLKSSMTFYMCGGEAPTEDYGSSPAAPAASAKDSAPAIPIIDNIKNKAPAAAPAPAAAVTPAPAVNPGSGPKVTTQVEIVYVTAYEYVNAKRHAHGHARRHQPFNA